MKNEREKTESFDEQVEGKYLELKDLPIVKDAFLLIDEGLKKKHPEAAERSPDVLAYHGRPHLEDVLHEAVLFALSEGVNDPKELELLAVAVSFHDAGFIKKYDNNEKIGAKLAAEYMKKSGVYSTEDIKRVKQIILSTQVEFEGGFKQLVQNDKDPLCRIIADADVSNFGRTDHLEKGEKVFQELSAVKKIPADNKKTRLMFNKFREKMVRTHKWQTASAKNLRGGQEQHNLQALKSKLSKK
ncbi:MAG: HD domain-containing protein [Candidatus Staskawiczbacteria bacterium]|nr:HD domain-containing protein [Candidatus Staskawiczbacteria bacterium]